MKVIAFPLYRTNRKMVSKELLFSVTAKDCTWDYYVGTGKGGQKRNKTANCVRCHHAPSGAVGKSEEGRSQRQNRERAFKRMAESKEFQAWAKIRAAELSGKADQIEKQIDTELNDPKITRVEVWEGKWVQR